MDAIVITKSNLEEMDNHIDKLLLNQDYSIVRREMSEKTIKYTPYSNKNKIRVISYLNSIYIDEKTSRLDICIVDNNIVKLYVLEYIMENYKIIHIIKTEYV